MFERIFTSLSYRIPLYSNNLYYYIYPKIAVKKIREKTSPINFVYVLYDLSTWKTEYLYLAMLKNPRFKPILAVTKNLQLVGHEKAVIEYLDNKHYPYVLLDESKTITKQLQVDIILYQRPYDELPLKHCFRKNRNALLVHLIYGFHSITESWALNMPMALYSWQNYFENDLTADAQVKYSKNKGKNVVVTGTPMMDLLALPKESYKNPWKNKDTRKHIIWAPHHTIGDIHLEGIGYGTFLDIADKMLSMVEEYKDKVCFAFKPHPQLYKNLLKFWEKERTDEYYHKWETMENTQFENGKYTGLFKYSDAMIHDCDTFTMEYLTTGNPVMYLIRDAHHADNQNECAKRSFELHYHGKTINDIRRFIDNVIADVDPRKEERMEFVNQYLRPPHGKTACENIMNAILGVEEYKDC